MCVHITCFYLPFSEISFGKIAHIFPSSLSLQSYTYLMDFEGIFHCQYPASPASPMAYAAVGLLTVGQGVMTRFGGMGFLFSGPKHFLSRRLLVAILVALGVW